MANFPSVSGPAVKAAQAVKDDPAAEGKVIVGKSGKYEVLDLHSATGTGSSRGNRHRQDGHVAGAGRGTF
jgi:hypothetical protein